MTFYPKRSLRILVLAVVALLALMVTGFHWIALTLALLLIGFAAPQVYEFGERELVLRSGLWRRRLAYSEISFAERRPVPGFGKDESITVKDGGGRQLQFTPADADGFLKALADQAPHVEIKDQAAGSVADST